MSHEALQQLSVQYLHGLRPLYQPHRGVSKSAELQTVVEQEGQGWEAVLCSSTLPVPHQRRLLNYVNNPMSAIGSILADKVQWDCLTCLLCHL